MGSKKPTKLSPTLSPVIDERFRRFGDCSMDEEITNLAKQELGETEEVRTECLEILENKLKESQDLNPCLEEIFLLSFLRVTKFDCSKAYERIRKCYQLRKRYPEVYDEFYPSSAPIAQYCSLQHFLPYRHPNNSVILVMKRGLFDPKILSFEEYFRLDLLALEALLDNPVTQVCGLTSILDLSGLSMNILPQQTPRRLRMFFESLQNSMPLRYKAIHIINAPVVFNIVYNLLYHLVSNKIRDRIIVHPKDDGWKSFHSHVPPEVLPEEYGGKLGPMDEEFTNLYLRAKEDYFKNQMQYGIVSKNKCNSKD